MSARKKVNQSRPRALARAAASRVAGAVCFDTADDAKLPPTRRSSRPPSNSSANADSSISPAPSGITASVLAECPVQSATPLYLSPPRRVGSCPTKGGGRACHLSPFTSATPRHAEQRVAAMLTRESECAKAAILRSRCEFHRTRYHAAAGFVTEKSGVSSSSGGWNFCRSTRFIPDSPRHLLFRRADSLARGGESHSPLRRRPS